MMNLTALLPPGFSFKQLYCFYDETKLKNHYSYAPLAIVLNDIDQQPDVSLTLSDEGAIFRWGADLLKADTSLLQQLKNEIANRYDISPGEITLSEVALSAKVALLVGKTGEKFEHLPIELAKGETETLTSTEKPDALAAVNGRKNYLLLEYSYDLTLQTSLKNYYSDDINELLRQLILTGNNGSKADCAAYIKKSIDDGDVLITQTTVNEPSPELCNQVNSEFCELFSDIAFKYVNGVNNIYDLPNPCNQTIDYSNGAPRQYPLLCSSDVATWLEGFTPTDFVHYSNTPIPNPHRPVNPDKPVNKTLSVSVSFKPSDFQISQITLIWGKSTETMPWNFGPTDLTSDTRGSLQIEVSYFFGGSYKSELAYTSEDWVIQPADAGLCLIELDATALEQHNKKVAGAIIYHPDRQGRRHTENFTFPDNGKWKINWYVTSLSNDLGGKLNGDYTLTPKGWGKPKQHTLDNTSETSIILK
ncbi:MAG: hypothetical protein RPS47_15300 [Colwellia sp.]|jgi:hypothetical protein